MRCMLLFQKRVHKRECALHLREGDTYGSNIESSTVVDIESIPGKDVHECLYFPQLYVSYINIYITNLFSLHERTNFYT
jgi:hypothetical protein